MIELIPIDDEFKKVLWRILNFYESYEEARYEREGRPLKHPYRDLILLKAWLQEISE